LECRYKRGSENDYHFNQLAGQDQSFIEIFFSPFSIKPLTDEDYAMKRKKIKARNRFNTKGMTLIELLVAMIICAMVVAGIYRVFIAQSRAYTVQDQVVEVQQSVRSAMEILLRDLRMTGFNYDNSPITITTPIATPLSDNLITVSYEYYDKTTAQNQKHTVAYWRDGNSNLIRQLTINDAAGPQETLLGNVEELNFTYGVDSNEDGALDNWLSASGVGTSKVVAVRVVLTARPTQVSPDVQAVSPRTLVSMVTLRNLCLAK
jgi:prepilin-type N-terminal cleavage/methylation domain-containing protein